VLSERLSILGRGLLILSALSSLLLLISLFRKPDLAKRNRALQANVEEVEAKNRALKLKIEFFRQQVQALKREEEVLYHAQMELGMLRGDEILYQFKEKQP